MSPYVYEIIEKPDIELWERVRQACTFLPDLVGKSYCTPGAKLSCHMVASALAVVFPMRLRVKHGFVKPAYEHSWNLTSFGNVMDAYPIGMISGGPVLIHRLGPIHHYEENECIVVERNLMSDVFARQVHEIVEWMRINLSKHETKS